MASAASLASLRKTSAALEEIRKSLRPFLSVLRRGYAAQEEDPSPSSSSHKKKRRKLENGVAAATTTVDPHRFAEAEAAVALAIGTLRYMGARLKGQDRGRKKDDPLRMELDRMRGMLVTLRKFESEEKKREGSGAASARGEPSPKKTDAAKEEFLAVGSDNETGDKTETSGAKRPASDNQGRVINVPASRRMVDAALAGSATMKDATPSSVSNSASNDKKKARSRSKSPACGRSKRDGGKNKRRKKP